MHYMYDKIYYVVHLVRFYGTYKNIHTVSVNNIHIRFFFAFKILKSYKSFFRKFFFSTLKSNFTKCTLSSFVVCIYFGENS